MAVITSIDGSSWATSGTADSTSTGLEAITGTNLVHVGSTDVPEGSSSTGYVQGDEDTNLSLKVDADASVFNSDNDHWVQFWFRGKITGTLETDPSGTDDFHFIHQSTGNLRLRTQWRGRTTDKNSGLVIFITDVNMTTTLNNYELMINNSGFDSSIPLDEWNQIAIHVHKDASDGRYALFFNGMLISELSDIDTTLIGDADLASDWTFTLTAIEGITWQLAPTIESWKGTDIALRPNWALMPASSPMKQAWPVDCWDDNTYPQGRYWTTSGTATNTKTLYGSPSNRRDRYVITGTVGQTYTLTSIDKIGALSYNQEGWATIVYKMVYSNSLSDVSWTIRNDADSADVIALTLNPSDQLKQGSTILNTMDATSRFAMCVHLRNNGEARWSLFDLTKQPATLAQKVFGGALDDWAPQSLGKVIQSCTLQDATGSIVDFDGIDVCEWVIANGIDSLVCSDSLASLTPTMSTHNRLSHYLGNEGNVARFPRGDFGMRRTILGLNQGYQITSIYLGWSGTDREKEWQDSIASYLDLPRGMMYLNLDGGSINDILSTSATPAVTDAASAKIKSDSMLSALGTMIDNATGVGNRVMLSTMLRRENYSSYVGFPNDAIDLFNNGIRLLSSTKQVRNLVTLCDAAGQISDHGAQFDVDNVHPNAAGELVYMTAMWASIGSSPQPADTLDDHRIRNRPRWYK